MPQALIRLLPRADIEKAITASSLPVTVEEYGGGPLLLVATSQDPKHHPLIAKMAALVQQLADQDATLQAAKLAAEAAKLAETPPTP